MEAIIDAANQSGDKIDAVLAENDSTALGVAAALKNKSYGIVPISGQDGDTANLQNVAAGIQYVDVWKNPLTGEDCEVHPIHNHYVAAELAPGAAKVSDAEIDHHIRVSAITVHHPLGTCKMGADGDVDAVVDPQFKVRGVEGLRVVDASIMPDAICGNINASDTEIDKLQCRHKEMRQRNNCETKLNRVRTKILSK